MARQVLSGAELNTTGSDVDFNGVSGGPVINRSIAISGDFSGLVTGLVSGTPKRFAGARPSNGNINGPIYGKSNAFFTAFPSIESACLAWFSSGGVARAWVTIDNSGVLRLYDETSIIGSPSSALSLNTSYYLEMLFDRSPAAGSHVIRARINGVEFAGSATRNVTTSGVAAYQTGLNIQSEANTAGSVFYDDWAANDNAGSFQNTYPGEGRIFNIRPQAAGDNTDWTGTTGTWADISEITPNDGTTTLSSNTLNQITDVRLMPTPKQIASTDTINVVAVSVRYAGVGASLNASFVLRVKASSGGTVEESAAVTPVNTGYRTNQPSGTATIPPLVLYDLPGASTTAWTKADLDQMQVGIRLSATSTNAAIVSTVWVSIEGIYTGILDVGHNKLPVLGVQ